MLSELIIMGSERAIVDKSTLPVIFTKLSLAGVVICI
jgi:hypothetical protein